MARSKIAISLDEATLQRLDRLVAQGMFPNRSQAIGRGRRELMKLVSEVSARDMIREGRAGPLRTTAISVLRSLLPVRLCRG